MKYVLGKPMKCKWSVVKRVLSTTSTTHHDLVDKRVIDIEKDYETFAEKKGREVEEGIADLLLMCLDGVEQVHIAPAGSVADDDWKVDIFLATGTGVYYGFQVKSSLTGATTHIDKGTDVPVIWLDRSNPMYRVELLKEMVQFLPTVVEIPDLVKKVVTFWSKARKVRKQWELKSLSTLSLAERTVLQTLLLGEVTGGVLLLK